MTFKMLETDVDGAVIKVVGVGGGGGNAVNHMVNRGVQIVPANMRRGGGAMRCGPRSRRFG